MLDIRGTVRLWLADGLPASMEWQGTTDSFPVLLIGDTTQLQTHHSIEVRLQRTMH